MTSRSTSLVVILAVQVVVGVALRAQFAGLAPLIPEIQTDLSMSFALAGWLTAFPTLFLGIMAFIGPSADRAAGARAAIAWALALVLVFSIVRAIAGDAAGVLAATVPIGIGIGLAGALIPAVLGELSPRLYGSAIGFYSVGLQLGAGGSAAVAVPLAAWLGGWRPALIVLAVPVAAAIFVWLAAWHASGGLPRSRTEAILPKLSVGLVLVFALQSMAYHSTATWLPARLAEAGWSASAGGAVLGLVNGVALLGTVGVAVWCRSARARRRVTLGGAVLLGASLASLALHPAGAIIWAVLAGLSFGVLFPTAITLPLDYAANPRDALRLTAGTLGLGYLLSAAASTLTGAFRDVAGSFLPVFLVLAAAGPLLAIVAYRLKPPAPPRRLRTPLDHRCILK